MKLFNKMSKKQDHAAPVWSRDELLKRTRSARRVLVENHARLVEHELTDQTPACSELHEEIQALLGSTSHLSADALTDSALAVHHDRVEGLRARLEKLVTAMDVALEERKHADVLTLLRAHVASWSQLTLESERALLFGIRNLRYRGVTEVDGVSLESIERDFERARLGPAMRRLHQEDMVDRVFRFETAGPLDPSTTEALAQFRAAVVANEALVVNHQHHHPFQPAHMVKASPQVFRVPLGIVPQLFGGSSEILVLDGLKESDIDTLLTLHGDDAYPTLVSARDAALALR